MDIKDKTSHMRPDKGGMYSFTLLRADGTTFYRYFKKKTPYLHSLLKRSDIRAVIIDLI